MPPRGVFLHQPNFGNQRAPAPRIAPDRYIGLKAFADARLLFHPKRQFPILGRRFGNVKLEEIGHVLRQLEILCEQIAVGVD